MVCDLYVCSLDDEPTWRTAMLVQFGRDPDGPRVNLTYLGGPIVTLDGSMIICCTMSAILRTQTSAEDTMMTQYCMFAATGSL